MKVLTYTLYKEHNKLYIKIYGSIHVNGCQIGPAQKRYHFTVKSLLDTL